MIHIRLEDRTVYWRRSPDQAPRQQHFEFGVDAEDFARLLRDRPELAERLWKWSIGLEGLLPELIEQHELGGADRLVDWLEMHIAESREILEEARRIAEAPAVDEVAAITEAA